MRVAYVRCICDVTKPYAIGGARRIDREFGIRLTDGCDEKTSIQNRLTSELIVLTGFRPSGFRLVSPDVWECTV